MKEIFRKHKLKLAGLVFAFLAFASAVLMLTPLNIPLLASNNPSLTYNPDIPRRLLKPVERIAEIDDKLALLNQKMDGLTNSQNCNCRFTKSSCVDTTAGEINLFKLLPDSIRNAIEFDIGSEVNDLINSVGYDIIETATDPINRAIDNINEGISRERGIIDQEIQDAKQKAIQGHIDEADDALDRINSHVDELEAKTKRDVDDVSSQAQDSLSDVISRAIDKITDIKDRTIEKAKEEIDKLQRSIEESNSQPGSQGSLMDFLEREREEKFVQLLEERFDSVIKSLKSEPVKNLSQKSQKKRVLAMVVGGKEVTASQEEINKRIDEINSRLDRIQSSVNTKSNDIESSFDETRDKIYDRLGIFGEMLRSMASCHPSPERVHGDPCKKRKGEGLTIERMQSQINRSIVSLNLLIKNLKADLNSKATKQQLEEIRKHGDAGMVKSLEDNLSNLILYSQAIAKTSQENVNLPNQCGSADCQPQCKVIPKKNELGLHVCIGAVSTQETIKMKFSVGLSLEDADLGSIGINKIALNLPNKISLPSLPKLSKTTINLPDIVINLCQTNRIVIPLIRPFAAIPETHLTLGCVKYPEYTRTRWSNQPGTSSEEYSQLDWYFKTFNWLSGFCQNLPGMKGWHGTPSSADFNKCFETDQVVPTAVDKCLSLWKEYCQSSPVGSQSSSFYSSECTKIISPHINTTGGCPEQETAIKVAAADRCKELFNQQGEQTPSSCRYTIDFLGNYIFSPDFNPIETISQRCDVLRKSGIKDPPESCKILPLFTGHIEEPEPIEINPEETVSTEKKKTPYVTMSSHNIGASIPMPDCFFSLPNLVIDFPKIIIPDIILPDFNIPPIVHICLPDFIFEDFQIPELKLCDLSECQFEFPYLDIDVPSLDIPEISPAVIIPWPGVSIEFAGIGTPSLSLRPPRLPNLGELITFKYELGDIRLPRPKLEFAFKGVEGIRVIDLAWTLLKKAIPIPPLSACFSRVLPFSGLEFCIPDVHFSLQRYLGIPTEIGPCDWKWERGKEAAKEVCDLCGNTQEFCRSTRKTIDEAADYAQEKIQKPINHIMDCLQEGCSDAKWLDGGLNGFAEWLKDNLYIDEIEKESKKITETIQEAIYKHLQKYAPEKAQEAKEYIDLQKVPFPGVRAVKPNIPCSIPLLRVPLGKFSLMSKDLSKLWAKWMKKSGAGKLYSKWPAKICIRWPKSGHGSPSFYFASDKQSCPEPPSLELPLKNKLAIPLPVIKFSKEKTSCDRYKEKKENCLTGCNSQKCYTNCSVEELNCFNRCGEDWLCSSNCQRQKEICDMACDKKKNDCRFDCKMRFKPCIHIPLEYKKDFKLPLSGIQLDRLEAPTITYGYFGSAGYCTSTTPTGGNPCQKENLKIKSNNANLINFAKETHKAAKEIKKILR